MTYDPNAGNPGPWGQRPGQQGQPSEQGQPGQPGQYGQQNQHGQSGPGGAQTPGQYGEQPEYGQYGSSSGGSNYSDYSQYGQSQSGDSGSSAPSAYGDQSGSYGSYGSGSAPDGYGQSVFGQQPQYGQDASGASQGGYGQDSAYGEYGQSGYGEQSGQPQSYGSPGYGDQPYAGAYGAGEGQPQDEKPKRKGLLPILIAAGVVLLLVVGLGIWEIVGRGSAGTKYESLIEEQGIAYQGGELEGDLTSSYNGGLHILSQLQGNYSEVVVTGTDLEGTNGAVMDLQYTLHNAPANADGVIDRVIVDGTIPADSILDSMLASDDMAEYEEFDVEVSGDGLVLTADIEGAAMEMAMQIRAEGGWMVMELVSVTYDGIDLMSEMGDEFNEKSDPCEDEGFESYVTEATIDEEGMHFQWEIYEVDTRDLAATACMS